MDLQESIAAVCCEVHPGLFVGSLRSLGYLKELNITHVLSAVNFPPQKDLSAYTTLHINLADDEEENLLAVLPRACAFIHAALTGQPDASACMEVSQDEDAEAGDSGLNCSAQPKGAASGKGSGAPGRILVHCQAGVSRSVSLAVAYLMRNIGCDTHEALSRLRAAGWDRADPNDGYMAQLDLFHDMRCRVDPNHPVYRIWAHEQVGRKREAMGYVDATEFAAPPPDNGRGCTETVYRCRKCRTAVASAHNILPLDAAHGHRVFRRSARGGRVVAEGGKQGGVPAAPPSTPSSSLFLEPMTWMGAAIVGEVQGKLYCPGPGCNARLGSFDWSGITNEQGQWVTPAFQVHTSKLDALAPARAHTLPSAATAGAPAGAGAPVGGVLNLRHPILLPPRAAAAVVGAPAAAPAAPAQAPPPLAQAQQQTSKQQAGVPSSSGELHRPPAKPLPGPPRTVWFTHVIFDCDGVLVDSERCSCEALRRAVRQVTGFDIPHQFPHDYTPVFGMDVRGCVAHYASAFPDKADWADQAAISAAVLAAKEVHYAQLTGEAGIPAIDGAAALITLAKELGMVVGVGSSGAPEKIARNLEVSGLAPLLDPDLVVSAAYVEKGKPAPDVYYEALRRAGCTDPRRAVVIEDTVNGLMSARAAGAFAVGVTNSLPSDVLAPHAHMVVSHLSELDLATLVPDRLCCPE